MIFGWSFDAQALGLRICARALLLVALATCRGVYFALEQPQTSCMRFFPDFVALRVAIQKMFGCYWYEQFLSRPQKASTLLETADEDRCKRSINHLCSLLYYLGDELILFYILYCRGSHKMINGSTIQFTDQDKFPTTIPPSYMGAHGALTMKPSRIWSTGIGAQSCTKVRQS